MAQPGKTPTLAAPWAPWVLCAAVALLALGMALGRFTLLRGGAVIAARPDSGAVVALAVAEAEAPEIDVAWRININTASAEELAELPGIGPAIAERIIQYRADAGDFEAPEEIMAVRGIGEGVYSRIRDYITVS
jgi:comEA protein